MVSSAVQDITPPERIEDDPKCDREVTVYGYLRGANLKPGTQAHLAGVGDMTVRNNTKLAKRILALVSYAQSFIWECASQ